MNILSNPLITHPLVSGLEVVAATMILTLAKGMGLDVHYAPIIAALVVSTFYYGREAGQREHDLKHMTPPKGAILAFLGAEFMFLWGRDNVEQWLVAAGSSALVAAGLTLAGY